MMAAEPVQCVVARPRIVYCAMALRLMSSNAWNWTSLLLARMILVRMRVSIKCPGSCLHNPRRTLFLWESRLSPSLSSSAVGDLLRFSFVDGIWGVEFAVEGGVDFSLCT